MKYASRNVLQDAALREAIKTFTCVRVQRARRRTACVRAHPPPPCHGLRSNWPTIPQVFIGGEFVGGSDILMGMHTSGELAEQLQKLKK